MHVIRPEGPLSYCTTCYYLNDTLESEACSNVTELSTIRARVEFQKARITDILRRSGVEDAEMLIGAVSRI